EHERNALVAVLSEEGAANKHRNAAAIFPEVFLLVRLKSPGRIQFRQSAQVTLAPFGRGQLAPAYATRNQVFPVISQNAEKGVVGFNDATFAVAHEDSDDVGVDQASNPRFAICDVVIKPRIFE